MSVVQLFNREERAYKDFEAVNRQHMIAFKDTIFAYALYYPAVELLSSIAIALVIWRGGFGVLAGTVTIGMLASFNMYSQRFWRPIQDLSDKYNILQAAMAACERIFKLLDTAPEIVSPANREDRRRLQPHRVRSRLVHLSEADGRTRSRGCSSAGRSAVSDRSPGERAFGSRGWETGCTVGFQAGGKHCACCNCARRHRRHRVDSERRFIHHRARPDGSDCGPHRRGQNHSHQPDDALLRCDRGAHSCSMA